MRQHAIDPILISEVRWTPFRGVRTLLIRALAQNEGREYNPLILFKNVQYHAQPNPDTIPVMTETGPFYIEPLILEDQDVLLRCACKDFFYRFNFYDYQDESLYGRKRTPYESQGIRPPANPLEMPGMCKHLIKLSNVLVDAGLFA